MPNLEVGRRSRIALCRLLDKHGIHESPETFTIHRLRPGRHQRSAGAWSWEAWAVADGRTIAASCFPLSEVLAKGAAISFSKGDYTGGCSREIFVEHHRCAKPPEMIDGY